MFITSETIVPIIIMGISVIGMLVCAKLQKSKPAATPLAVLFLLMILVCGAMVVTKSLSSGGDLAQVQKRESSYIEASAYVLAKNLAEAYPDSTALIIAPQNFATSKRVRNLMRGFTEGAGQKISFEIAARNLKRPDGKHLSEDSMFSAKQFDELMTSHPKCNIIISLIGLPLDAGNMKIWKLPKKTRPHVALMFGNIYDKKKAFQLGFINMAVSYNPGVKASVKDVVPSDPQKAFDQRYLLITTKNIDKIAAEHPHLFAPDNSPPAAKK